MEDYEEMPDPLANQYQKIRTALETLLLFALVHFNNWCFTQLVIHPTGDLPNLFFTAG